MIGARFLSLIACNCASSVSGILAKAPKEQIGLTERNWFRIAMYILYILHQFSLHFWLDFDPDILVVGAILQPFEFLAMRDEFVIF